MELEENRKFYSFRRSKDLGLVRINKLEQLRKSFYFDIEKKNLSSNLNQKSIMRESSVCMIL